MAAAAPPQPAPEPEPECKPAPAQPRLDPVAETYSPQRPLATDALNWSELAFELKLDAIARQVVLNTVVLEYKQDALTLGLLAEMDIMLKDDIQRQIKTAIEEKLAVSLSLEFSSLPALEVETPQQASERKQEQERQAAIAQIRQDPLVRQLNTLFTAELIESTVNKSKSE